MSKYSVMRDILITNQQLHIVSGQQLIITHVVPLHPKESCVMICFLVTASFVTADPNVFTVLLQLLKTFFHFITLLFLLDFPVAHAVYKSFSSQSGHFQIAFQDVLHIFDGISLPKLKLCAICGQNRFIYFCQQYAQFTEHIVPAVDDAFFHPQL